MDFEFNKVDSIDKVPEQFRPLYVQGEDGFEVNSEHKPIADAVLGLNRSLKAARAEAKSKTPVDLSPLETFGKTPEEIAQSVQTRISELEEQLEKGSKDGVNIDKIKADLQKAHAGELQKSNARSEALQNQLYEVLVEKDATAAIAEAKGVPDLLLPFVKNQIKVHEQDGAFVVSVVDPSGDIRYSGVTGQPMTIKELVTEMKANEKYGRLFESEAPDGGGFPPNNRQKNFQQNNQQPRSANDKIAAGLNNRSRRR